MGLHISYGCFNGGYSQFMRFRTQMAEKLGIPLALMEGFYAADTHNPFTLLNYNYPKGDELEMSAVRRLLPMFPLKWEAFVPTPLHELLYHSDCDGEIAYTSLIEIVPELEKLLVPSEQDSEFYKLTQIFIEGAKEAIKQEDNIVFG